MDRNTCRKKRRRVKSSNKQNEKEISASVKSADISQKLDSESIHNAIICDRKSLDRNYKNTVTYSESSSSEDNSDYVIPDTPLIPTISESSNEASCFSEDFSSGSETDNLSDKYMFSDSSISDLDSEPEESINDFLRGWFLSFRKVLPESALTSLLKGLRRFFPTLPADARTLLRTHRSIEVVDMGDGQFYNFGLNKMLTSKLNSILFEEPPDTLHFNVNIDGLPLYKSSKAQFWPILLSLREDPENKPFAVAIFHGKTKPPLNEFIMPFVTEFSDLEENGLHFNGKTYQVKIRCFTCDAPCKSIR